jgi:uncharacterized protein (TIGR03492 family)
VKLLFLSNGHGEDEIAARLITQLRQSPHCPDLAALPLVGTGQVYARLGIPLLGEARSLPSGGFIYMDARQFLRDLRGGLLGLTSRQYRQIRNWGQDGGKILAIGDIVPLALAWASGAEYAFVGTAKSEYYLRDETGWLESTTWLDRSFGSYYYPWERWLMAHPRCRAVFPRDRLTAKVLQQWSIPVVDAGNPMMDELIFPVDRSIPSDSLTILLLPGSRTPECLGNWQKILQAVTAIRSTFGDLRLEFIAAIAPSLPLESFIPSLIEQGWQKISIEHFICQDNSLYLSLSNYAENLARADLAIAMAGTATEQFVGLGKPAMAIEGTGPQFTPHFARLQTRLLGPSLILVSQPAEVAIEIEDLLKNPDRWRRIAENGRERMGIAGASERITRYLLADFISEKP